MQLAKAALDVGLFTHELAAQQQFWGDTLGLATEPFLRLGGGIHQHRFVVGASIVKVNHARGSLAPNTGGISRIGVVRAGISQRTDLSDPDGNLVTLLPAAEHAGVALSIQLTVSDLAVHQRFWRETLQFESRGLAGVVCGSTRIELIAAPQQQGPQSWQMRGWSYLTIQVKDCIAEHALALQRGAHEGEPPRRLGDVAIVSFLRDPDGNFIELSQKAALVGALAADDRPVRPGT